MDEQDGFVQILRHDTGATISLKTETRPVITRIGNAILIQVGVSPIAATPVKGAARSKVA